MSAHADPTSEEEHVTTLTPDAPLADDQAADAHDEGGPAKAKLFEPSLVRRAIGDAFRKLSPAQMTKNPVMFIVEIGCVLTTLLFLRDLVKSGEPLLFTGLVTLWLWFTVLFANFAEAIAEGRGKAQADTLRKTRSETVAKVRQPDGTVVEKASTDLETIDEESDRLDKLVGNLLDMSRLQTGTLQAVSRPVGWEEVVAAALASLSGDTSGIVVDVPETLPEIVTDPALLERAVANIVANAIDHADGKRVRITAGAVADRVDLRVIDEGPGVPADDRGGMFEPFQRLGDRGGTGVGLGLAVARGFVEATGGEIAVEETPGGGLTMVVSMPRSGNGLPPSPSTGTSTSTDDETERSLS